MLGTDKALQFFAGYVVELSLSVDNLFVFLLLFKFFQVIFFVSSLRISLFPHHFSQIVNSGCPFVHQDAQVRTCLKPKEFNKTERKDRYLVVDRHTYDTHGRASPNPGPSAIPPRALPTMLKVPFIRATRSVGDRAGSVRYSVGC